MVELITVVCVSNKKNILDRYLVKSLQNQTVEYELIIVDNSHGKYRSATEALNYGGKFAGNEFIMFVHQDIDFLSDTWLEEANRL